MERMCRQNHGLFPTPAEIKLSCSCPDWADMCKHVAAVLYGIGARLDERPQLLFVLRKVDEKDLFAAAGSDLPLAADRAATGKRLDSVDLGQMFGIEMVAVAVSVAKGSKAAAAKARRAATKPRTRKGKKAASKAAKDQPLHGPRPTGARSAAANAGKSQKGSTRR